MFFKCSYLGNKAHLAQIRFFRLPESLPYSGFLQRVIFTTSSKGEIELWYLFLVGRWWFFLLWWSCFVLKKKKEYMNSVFQALFKEVFDFFSFLRCFLPCKSFTSRKYWKLMKKHRGRWPSSRHSITVVAKSFRTPRTFNWILILYRVPTGP